MQVIVQRIGHTLIILLVLIVGLATQPPTAASPQPNALAVLSLQRLPQSQSFDRSLSGISVGGRTVWASDNNGTIWRKADNALGFDILTQIQPPPIGQPNELKTAISALANGSAYLVWADYNTYTIMGHQLRADGELGPPELIHSGSQILADLAVAATANGTVVVIARNLEHLWYRSRSPATHGVWTDPIALPASRFTGSPVLATGPDDRIGLVFATHSGAIDYGEWDGQNFDVTPVTTVTFVTGTLARCQLVAQILPAMAG